MGACLSAHCLSAACVGKNSLAKESAWATIDNSPIDAVQIVNRTVQEDGQVTLGKRTMSYGVIGFRGYYPDEPFKDNQDKYTVVTPDKFKDTATALFGVFDGHGQTGDKCAEFVRDNMSTRMPVAFKGHTIESIVEPSQIKSAMTDCFVKINEELHKNRIDDSLSGTTAICVAAFGDSDGNCRLLTGNVGDSRSILISKDGKGGFVAKALSTDQTPYRKDERQRVKNAGARVMNVNQLEGLEEMHENWNVALGDEVDDQGDPPRVWRRDAKCPGTAFTRSIGDSVAEELGVFAEPEFDFHTVSDDDLILVVASDGVWEFLTNQTVMSLALSANTPQDAAIVLWQQSFKEWISKEPRTDDITVIVVDLADVYTDKANKLGNISSEIVPSGGVSAELGSMNNTEKSRNVTPSRRGSTKVEVQPNAKSRRGSLQ